MPWFRLDDSFHSHPKVIAAGNEATGLYVRCGTYAAQHLTDGFIPQQIALLYGSEALADALVGTKLWRRTRGGWQMPDYLDYNPSAEQVKQERKSAAERQRRYRSETQPRHNRDTRTKSVGKLETKIDNSREMDGAAGNSTSEDVPSRRDSRVTNAVSHTTPTRPDPARTDLTPPSHPSGAPPPRAKRATRIPDNFKATPEMVTWARENVPHVNGALETEKFIDYWRAESTARAAKRDWGAAWRNWMRKAVDQRPQRAHGSRQAETDQLFDEAFERARERDAQEASSDERRNGAAHAVRQSLLPAAGDR